MYLTSVVLDLLYDLWLFESMDDSIMNLCYRKLHSIGTNI